MISRSGTRRSGAASGFAKILREEGSGPVVTAGRVVSGLERMFMVSSLVSRSGGFGALTKPLFDPCIGVGVLGDIGNDGDGIGAGGKNGGGLFEFDAADTHTRDGAYGVIPFSD